MPPKADFRYLGTTRDQMGVLFFHFPEESENRRIVIYAAERFVETELEITDTGLLLKARRLNGETPVQFSDRIWESIEMAYEHL